MPFKDILRSVQSVGDMISQIFDDSIFEAGDEIVRLNRKNLSEGTLSTDKDIIPQYSEPYANKKGFNTPDLFVSGDFYRSIFVTRTNKLGELFVASDLIVDGFPLANHLEEQYTSDIYGITDVQKEHIENVVADKIIKRIENGLKI